MISRDRRRTFSQISRNPATRNKTVRKQYETSSGITKLRHHRRSPCPIGARGCGKKILSRNCRPLRPRDLSARPQRWGAPGLSRSEGRDAGMGNAGSLNRFLLTEFVPKHGAPSRRGNAAPPVGLVSGRPATLTGRCPPPVTDRLGVAWPLHLTLGTARPIQVNGRADGVRTAGESARSSMDLPGANSLAPGFFFRNTRAAMRLVRGRRIWRHPQD